MSATICVTQGKDYIRSCFALPQSATHNRTTYPPKESIGWGKTPLSIRQQHLGNSLRQTKPAYAGLKVRFTDLGLYIRGFYRPDSKIGGLLPFSFMRLQEL
jgi:hypothetical protein